MRTIRVGIVVLAAALSSAGLRAGELAGPPIDAQYLTAVTFGKQSHWLQPWRAYLETMPARHFVEGTGVVLTFGKSDPDLMLRHLAKNGIRHGRIEIGWSSLDWDDETRVRDDGRLRRLLQACQRHGVRPLLLLNAHHGAPGPVRYFERTTAAAAARGDRTVRLTDASGLTVGRSGLSRLTDYWAAEALVTRVEGQVVTLSKPLPKAIPAGARVPMATLKYRPFGDPAGAEFRETLDGWKRYARTVARFATDALGSAGRADLGFDLEIWNELSFGSNFLNINAYYEPDLIKRNANAVYAAVVRTTADLATTEPAAFAGVLLVDGFSNTIPWPASSTTPPRVAAISKHPYAGRKTYPKDNDRHQPLDARGRDDRSGFVPSYTQNFPEYFATALQTETITRDLAPLTTDIYGTRHGRHARGDTPCWTWITEVNFVPHEDGISDAALARRLKAKAAARYFCFYLNKGVQRLYLYASNPNEERLGDIEFGVVRQNLVEYARKQGTDPAEDGPYTSEALLVTRRITAAMKKDLASGAITPRPLRLLAIRDDHDRQVFAGDPNDPVARPPLYHRDVLAILPFQCNARRFVIPYYVMTRDLKVDLKPERFTVEIAGLRGAGAAVSAYDPLNDRPVPVAVQAQAGDRLTLSLTATDYPYLLLVEEAR